MEAGNSKTNSKLKHEQENFHLISAKIESIIMCIAAFFFWCTVYARIDPTENKIVVQQPIPKPKAVVKKKQPLYVEKKPATQTVKFVAYAPATLWIDGEEKGQLKTDRPFRYNNKHLRYPRINFSEPVYHFSELGTVNTEKSSFQFVVTEGKLNIKMNFPKPGNCVYGIKEARADFTECSGTGGYESTWYITLVYNYSCGGIVYEVLHVGLKMNKTTDEFYKLWNDELRKYFL